MAKNDKIQAKDVRDALLSHGPDAINRLVLVASGFEVNEDGTKGDYDSTKVMPDILLQIVNKIIPVISLEDDNKKHNNELAKATTIERLREMHSEGSISIKELQQYTQIIRTNYEVTELPQLMAKLEEMEGK